MTTDRSQLADPSGGGRTEPATQPSRGPALPVPTPRTIGKYEILERIGAGAMGVVYKCRQPGLDRPVAVKVLLTAQHADADQVQRFQREARSAARLTHPNVVQIYDVGVDGDLTYFVMELVEGCALDKLIGTPALTLPVALRLLVHVARALEAAHDQGIIHRDIKPSNILIHRSGQPKLADFGLAKSLYDTQVLSRSGDLVGTPRYMSPEQVLAEPGAIDHRTDVYSLGVVMYEMLTGRSPVDGPNVLAIVRQLSDEEPLPLREVNSEVPEEVAAICQRAMARDRDARFATAGAFAEALQGYLFDKFFDRSGPSSDHARELLTALPPLMLPPPSSSRFWVRRRVVLALVLLGIALLSLGAVGTASFWRGGSASTGLSSEPTDDQIRLRAQLVSQARNQLNGMLLPPETTTPRDWLKGTLEDATALLKRSPDDVEVRALRASMLRHLGEHLAAVEDLTQVLQHDPQHLGALTERLLATYELHILYLGNFKEPALRPSCLEVVQADLQTLRNRGDTQQRALAGLIEALANQDIAKAGQLAQAEMPATRNGRDSVNLPDLAMVQADALFQAAEQAYSDEQATEGDKMPQRKVREGFAHRAGLALRRGLDANPNHVGLLFLKANSFQRRARWETAEKEDEHDAALRRHKPAFETTCDRLRRATLRVGCDTYIARAVLLSNFGRDAQAEDQLQDALSCRPLLPYLYTLRAWLELQAPPDGLLSTEEVDRMLRDLEPAFETPPEDFRPWLVRSILLATAGHWEDARRDLRECRRRLGPGELPQAVANYSDWLSKVGASTSEFLAATRDFLDNYSVPPDVRLRLGQELLQRLGDAGLVTQDGLKDEQVRDLKGWAHFHLAQVCAQKEDRPGVLKHVREALQLHVPDLTPQSCRADGTLSAWNEDKDFVALYTEFEKP
jgi:serine/threonine protein kinase